MSRFNPHYKHAAEIFKAADDFKRRCLLDQDSLFQEQHGLWAVPNLEELVNHFAKRPNVGSGTFYEKLATQLALCSPLEVSLMAEVFWLVQLPVTNLTASTRIEKLKVIWNIKPAGPFPADSPYLDSLVLNGLGSAGPGYNNYLPLEVAFAVQAFADFAKRPRDEREALLSDWTAFAQWLNSIPSSKGRQFYHTLCHVFFPDYFERIFSQGNKNQVTRYYKIWYPGLDDDRPAMDTALLELRKRLETDYPGVVDHYALPVGTLVKGAIANSAILSNAAAIPAAVNVTEPIADDEENAEPPNLRSADNLIFYGPPGTGKTHAMQARMKEAFDKGESFIFVAFHPNYSYEDFIGGLRPSAAPGGAGLTVQFQKGPFIELCDKAHANPTQQFTVFIDEINRANVAKVFGELITLVEPSKRVVAGSEPNESGAWVTLPGLGAPFGVPDNVNFVATMNTADRSVAMMDLALRRRFRFQECPPLPGKIDPPTVGKIDLRLLLERLNDRLEYLRDSEYAIGHSLFMGVTSLPQLQQVIAERVIPLLKEYFFDDLTKVRLVLTGSYKEDAFFASRTLSPSTLFSHAQNSVGTEVRSSYRVTDPTKWTEADIIGMYGVVQPVTPTHVLAPVDLAAPVDQTATQTAV
jgi:5-methylcytosine-specific restriction protein B